MIDPNEHSCGTVRPHGHRELAHPEIGYYAIAEKSIPLEHAVRSATGLPADILGLTDRGYLRPGYKADIAIWEPNRIKDNATFEDPHNYSQGMVYVLVNGQPVVHLVPVQRAVDEIRTGIPGKIPR